MKKFIITDPCYIMNNNQYDNICISGCNFEDQEFPLKSTHIYTNKEIVFHIIKGTPNGDGSFIYRSQDIGVDSGMLCIAECDSGWSETLGATFSTLEQCKNMFPKIISKF